MAGMSDPYLSSQLSKLKSEHDDLKKKVRKLERRLELLIQHLPDVDLNEPPPFDGEGSFIKPST